jgi:hypothetical protein
MKIEVKNLTGKSVGSVDLDDSIFGAEIHEHLLWEVVKWQLARRRAGTASTKRLGEVRGSSKKVWKQKGTGQARQGSRQAPHWVGGGYANTCGIAVTGGCGTCGGSSRATVGSDATPLSPCDSRGTTTSNTNRKATPKPPNTAIARDSCFCIARSVHTFVRRHRDHRAYQMQSIASQYVAARSAIRTRRSRAAACCSADR